MTTIRQQLAQMLIMGFAGTTIDDNNPVKRWLTEENIGGVLLFDYDMPNKCFGKNIIDTEQIKRLTAQIKHYSPQAFIAIDYEGGEVDRLKHVPGMPKTISPQRFAQLSLPEQHQIAAQMASTLKGLGFNLNFAPLLDLNLNQTEGIIGKMERSYSADPKITSEIALQFVNVFAKAGLVCCYKHFPGHGSARGDTHEGFVDVTETYHPDELQPYARLLDNATQPIMVMTAHVINRRLDPTGLPATLSPAILTGLLRQTIGYDGVIISDDLQMRAISQQYSLPEALQRTINAGADMVIVGNQLDYHDASEILDAAVALVESGGISRDHLNAACRRISALKAKAFNRHICLQIDL